MRLDFIRMRRFLFTAYNDLATMDPNIEDDVLEKLKIELLYILKEYEFYCKKTRYTLQYAFDNIFLAHQVEYNRTIKHIEKIQSSLANAKVWTKFLQNTLADKENTLAKCNRGSKEYVKFEKEVKAVRRRYVDLLNFTEKQKNAIVRESVRVKRFREEHLKSFSPVYESMTKELKSRFIALLDTKAYDFDTTLWDRAKQSQNVIRFFRNSRIEGSFSSKTFLRYFLQRLDKTKLTARAKSLFDLLNYLENANRKSLLIVRKNAINISEYQQVIEKIDSSLLIATDNDPRNALKNLILTPMDIVVIDEKIGDVNALGFITTYKSETKSPKKIVFCVIVHTLPPQELIAKGRAMNVEFVLEHNMDMLYDCIRMAL